MALAMNMPAAIMNAIRSITTITLAAGALVLTSCATAEREDNGDRQADELGSIPQQPHSAVCSGGQWACKARVRTDAQNKIKPFATPSGLGPADLTSAYKLTGTPPAGTTVAIVDAFSYPNAESDLATYRSQFGLPACTVASGCLTLDNAQGAGPSPAGDDWTVEAALDLDMVSAACPTCKIVLINAKDDQGSGLNDGQHQAAGHAGVVAISDSWGGPSDGTDLTQNSQFFTISGVNIFIASGDNGNTGTTPDVPSTLANVIGVGGTSLTKSSNTRGWTEGAWSGAGSSCSKLTAKPSFQSSVVSSAVCADRAAADVSSVADPNTGLAVFNAGSGGWIVVGGTSAAAPFVAGVFARYGIAKTNDASFPYAHANQFFDVTTGSNGSCGGALCNAGAGWDGPTGLGTPNGAVLGGGGTCTPSCTGKTCGSDGCGGSCGTCGTGQTCSPGGTCTTGGTCSHPICSTGGALTASCDTCAAQVCAADSFCCSNSWDSICVGEVSSVCHQTCGGGTCAHAICATGTKLTASCDPCAQQICAVDSFCCGTRWDSQCVSEVTSVCKESCN
jgi:hypothetical protein